MQRHSTERLSTPIPRKVVEQYLASGPLDPRSYPHFEEFCHISGFSAPSLATFRHNVDQLLGPEPPPSRPLGATAPGVRRARREPAPTPLPARLREFPAETHARRLLERITETRDPEEHGILRTPEIQEIYAAMCEELGWRPRPWNPVAHRFTQITTGRKVYDNVLLEDGMHKLRVYPLSTPTRMTDEEIPPEELQPKSRRAA